MYTLYLDKPEDFICEVSVKNASLKNSIARMIIKSDDLILLFEGKIENGKCTIPIRRLKGLINENVRGNMKLEIILEDTYFSPWNDEFKTEEYTSVKVRVDERTKSSKPIVEVKSPLKYNNSPSTDFKKNILIPLVEISNICKKFGITRENLSHNKIEFKQIIKEYFNLNHGFINNKSFILSELKNFMK